MRASILLLGLVIGQFVLYGPSLLGRKILLPLELLHDPGTQGAGAGAGSILPHDRLLTDPINQIEPMRRFAVNEVRAGRWPLWDPFNYCGAPFLAANQGAVFSPYRLLDYLWPDPRSLAWSQLLRAVVTGVGAYVFFRSVLHAHPWAAMLGAWIWPHCGFLVIWTMWPISAAASWLPWVLWAVARCVCSPGAGAIVMLSVFTAFAIVSGHSATGAQVLLGSGIYSVWRLWNANARVRRPAVLSLIAGWMLGGCLAAPQLLPTLEYMQHSLRMTIRLQAGAETPPVGLSALPQLLLPWVQGRTKIGWIYLGPDNPLESAIGGYVGVVTALVLAPIALANRRRRRELIFWLVLAAIASSYVLNLPGGWWLHRLPVLDSLRGNRMIFITGFALLTGAVLGLDTLLRARITQRRWMLIGPALSVLLMGWCLWRAEQMNDIIAMKTAPALSAAQGAGEAIFQGLVNVVMNLTRQFERLHYAYATLCLAAAGVGLALWRWGGRPVALAAGGLALAEVMFSVASINPQADPALYNWNLPAFESISRAEPGRICGVLCLPPMLNRWGGLSDIRGYDAADPLRYVQVLQQLAAPNSPTPDPSAATFALLPKYPSPLADFLNLRYLIVQGAPADPSTSRFVTPSFHVIENKTALDRVTVPRQTIVVTEDAARLSRLGDPSFNPREQVLVETDIALPPDIQGSATIVREIPSQVEIEYTMATDGLVVLADTWDAGWRATVNGEPAPVLRANHAFRAVRVSAGTGRIVLTYWPRSLRAGLGLAGLGMVGMMGIFFVSRARRDIIRR